MSGVLPLLSLYAFIVWTGTNLLLILLVNLKISGDISPLFHMPLWRERDEIYLSLLKTVEQLQHT